MSIKTLKNDLKYWVGFNNIITIGPCRFNRLLKYFSNLETAWLAPISELLRAGLEQKVVEEIISRRREIDPDRELKKVEKLGIKVITILAENYPPLLKEIYAPPPLLYCLGELDLNNDFPLAVVGRRKISNYGQQITSQLVSELVNCGLTIISGLALGVDAAAHQATIKSGGKTIAVLGSGLDLIYPRANYHLAQNIIEAGGGIISEFPLGMPAFKSNFPQRNRIISGLSLGVLITEAGEKSGALITAKYALEQNREVFAVPGNIYTEGSGGTNKLIKMGAQLVTGAADILETLNLAQVKNFKAAKAILPETETEKLLLKLLADQELHIDKLVKLSRLDISVVNSTLAIMEMKGMIKNLGS